MAVRAIVPVFATVEVWAVLVVKVSVVGLTVASHFPLVTDSVFAAFALTTLTAWARGGAASTASSRTAVAPAVLHATRKCLVLTALTHDWLSAYWLVATPS